MPIAGSIYQPSGLPDRLIIKDGVHIFIEFKGENTMIRSLQRVTHDILRAHGARVYVVRFLKSGVFLINESQEIHYRNFLEGVEKFVELAT